MEEKQVFKFELDQNEANLVIGALGKLPAETSMGLILKLQQQAAPQIQPAAEVQASAE